MSIVIIAMAMMFTACGEDPATTPAPTEGPLTTIHTRANDALGEISDGGFSLYMNDAAGTRRVANYRWNTQTNTFKIDPAKSEAIVLTTGTHNVESITGSITVPYVGSPGVTEGITVSAGNNLTIDIVVQADGTATTATPFTLTAAHARLALVIKGEYGEGTLTAADGTFTVTPIADAIPILKSPWTYPTNPYSHVRILPGTVAAGTDILTLTGQTGAYAGTTYTIAAPEDITFLAGHQYTLTVQLSGSTATANVTGITIAPFAPGIDTTVRTYKGIKDEADLREFAGDWNAAAGATDIFAARDAVIAKWADATGTIRLLADIDLTGTDKFPTIGRTGNPFTARFHGGGHTIAGLTITGDAPCTGLFGYTSSTAAIYALHLEDAEITSSAGGEFVYTGGIVGWNNGGIIAGCSVSGTVTSATTGTAVNTGGIAGQNGGTIAGCYTRLSALAGKDNFTGHIAGQNGSTNTTVACHYYPDEDTHPAVGTGPLTFACQPITLDAGNPVITSVQTELMNAAIARFAPGSPVKWVHITDTRRSMLSIVQPEPPAAGITTEADLRLFAAHWNANRDDARAKWLDADGAIHLLADITLTPGVDFTPIGTGTNTFTATFNGGGHTITGLQVTTDGNSGLFGFIAAGGAVYALHLEDATITGTNNNFTGGIAGRNNGTIAACSVSGTVNGGTGGTTGGIVGLNSVGTIAGCYTHLTALAGQPGYTGCIAGANNPGAILTACHYGAVGAYTEAGYSATPATNCYVLTTPASFYDLLPGSALTLMQLMNGALDELATRPETPVAVPFRWEGDTAGKYYPWLKKKD